ncbi:MAG: hypothetical protein ACPG5U_01965 [Planktomarina sp.]
MPARAFFNHDHCHCQNVAMKSDGRKIQTPSIYRTLKFLTTNGLAHRIESLNAYVGGTEDKPVFIICDGSPCVEDTRPVFHLSGNGAGGGIE